MTVLSDIELLFDRPNEKLSKPKDENNKALGLATRFLSGNVSNEDGLNSTFIDSALNKIQVKNLDKLPEFKKASELPVDADFSLFLPKHQEMATEVIDALMSIPENQLNDFLATSVYARDKLNPQLFNYCLTVALMHRNDTKNVRLQNFAEAFPSKFLDAKVFSQAMEAAALVQKNTPIMPITIPRDYTATDLDIEHRMAYFREDIGVNLHHWHWHLVYPFTANDRKLVAKDRRGELFYYMHQQIIARYNGERLNNSLARTKKFSNWRESILEAYFPKLDSLTSSRGWAPRQANMRWQDLKRDVDGLNVTISDMERWRRNLEEAIATGRVQLPNSQDTQQLDIDTLGNMVEASILSPNRDFYGNIHNNGHNFTAYMHDPQHRYLENFGVMGDVATAMRDPYFYRWHSWVDDLFQRYKESSNVSRYTRSELQNENVVVSSVAIESDGGTTNTLNTFWMLSDVDLSRGLDFADRGSVYARFTHLNHTPFRYVINVENKGEARRTTMRIFIAPKYDERKLPWTLLDQRKMFIEMDRFVVQLTAGSNKIVRNSTDSSISIPFEQTFRDLSASGSDPNRGSLAASNYCGCGWPQHMLVPKGTESGAAYQLFVMASNYELDKIEQTEGEMSCKQASSFCGLRDKLYPDKRAMGFPFDRPPASARNIEEFILPNMALVDITIRLNNETKLNPKNPVYLVDETNN